MSNNYILKISCPDKTGIIASVSRVITEIGGFITESSQYGDPDTNNFFMRIEFSSETELAKDKRFSDIFENVVDELKLNWQLFDKSYKPKTLLMVSKEGHCLNHILHKYETGLLNTEIKAVVSNHDKFKKTTEWYNIPFYHLPISKNSSPADRQKQEEQILNLVDEYQIDLMVLARYMQILSPNICEKLYGKIINIHHSFLPSFKGADPYKQAHVRGVKIIGATAHYVTKDLDEGPIITQEVTRVSHNDTVKDLRQIGQDIESSVLLKAIKAHIEHRVFLDDVKTVVF